jgi:putative ABC transport system permease protein
MRLWRRLRSWSRANLGRSRMESEMDAELKFHMDAYANDLIRSGVSREEAMRRARLEFGGVELAKEECREAIGAHFVQSLAQDIRYALRMLRKSPGFTAVAVLTLALGIGANAAIFSVANAVLLRPLPYPNHARLLRVEETHPGGSNINTTYATFLDLQRESRTLENLAAFRPWSFNITGEGNPEQVVGALVSGEFFSSLGTPPYLGRWIGAGDNQAGGNNNVVVLSYALWRSHYGRDPGILTKTVTINGERYSVIGVMPPGFAYPDESEIWSPLVPGGSLHANRRAHLLTMLADMPRGVALAAVGHELSALARNIERQNPGVDDGLRIDAVSLKTNMVAPVRPALLILIFAVGLLLLIACANVANLLLARASSRRKEIALRLALGSSRPRIARQLFTESALIAMLGGAAGIGLASWGLTSIVTLNSADIPRLADTRLDWHVLGFVLLLSLATAFLFGLAPALTAMKVDLNSSFKEAVGGGRNTVSRALVAVQFALAVLLLVGAGLLGRSFLNLIRVNPGFNTENLLTLQVFLSPVEYPEFAVKDAIALQDMLERIRAVPGVRNAAVVNCAPIAGGVGTDFVLHDRPAPPGDDEPEADIRVVDPAYFRTMGIPLLQGREFARQDTKGSGRVMIVNKTMARTFWPHGSPLGKQVTMKDWGPPLTGEIIGVVGDVKPDGLDAAVRPMIYWPYFQFPQNFNTFVVRAEGNPGSLISTLKGAIWQVDKNQPIARIQSMDQILSESMARRRTYMVLLAVFALAALLLAAVGIYGVVSYSVSRKTKEIGVRLALGAQRIDVWKFVLGEGARLALVGVTAGMFAAAVLTRLMTNLLFGIGSADPPTFAGVAALLLLIALFASYIPARRAMRVDPMVALRHE